MNFMNFETGARREYMRESEIPVELRKTCPLPCYRKNFKVNIAGWHPRYMTRTMKVKLDGFTIEHREEYLECDSTCIIGNIGGNIGFFLGASILLGLDVILKKVRIFLMKIKRHI